MLVKEGRAAASWRQRRRSDGKEGDAWVRREECRQILLNERLQSTPKWLSKREMNKGCEMPCEERAGGSGVVYVMRAAATAEAEAETAASVVPWKQAREWLRCGSSRGCVWSIRQANAEECLALPWLAGAVVSSSAGGEAEQSLWDDRGEALARGEEQQSPTSRCRLLFEVDSSKHAQGI